MTKTIDKTSARQGATPGVMRYVLSIGLILVIVAFGVVWYLVGV